MSDWRDSYEDNPQLRAAFIAAQEEELARLKERHPNRIDPEATIDELQDDELRDIYWKVWRRHTRPAEEQFGSISRAIGLQDEVEDEIIPKITDNLQEFQFQEQCALIENFQVIARKNFDHQYQYFTSIHGNPGLITNKMARRDMGPLWDITPEQLSHLQPTLRLFKVRYNENDEEVDAVELPFTEHVDENDLTNITNPQISRGSGANLVNFDWKLQGTNPAEATNVIACSMTFRFQSLQDFAKEYDTIRKDGSVDKISFVEFFTLPPKLIKERNEVGAIVSTQYNPNYFTFRGIIGWAAQDGAMGGRADLRELNKALKRDQRIFTLTMTNHDIEFYQEGHVEITIEANARLDVVSWLQESDIYAPFREAFDEQKEIYLNEKVNFEKLEKCVTGKKTETEEEKINEEEEKLKDILDRVQLEKTRMWSKFLEETRNQGRIFALVTKIDDLIYNEKNRKYTEELESIKDANPEVINRHMQAVIRSSRAASDRVAIGKYIGTLTRTVSAEATKETDKLIEEVRANAELQAVQQLEGENYIIPFIYLGDIIDQALEALHYGNNKYTTSLDKTFLGDIVLYDPREQTGANQGKRYSVNLADIPISVAFFKDWFLRQVHGSNKGEQWPVKAFIRDLIETMIAPALNPVGCFIDVPQRAIKLATTYRNVAAKGGIDPIAAKFDNRCNRINIETLDGLEPAKKPFGENIANYYIIYAAESFPPGRIANEVNDAAEGIYHFVIGRDRGLIKTINFQRSDMPYMRESRIVSEGDSQFSRLREHYNAKIEMVGNNLFVPGDAIFVNPSTIVFGNPTKPNSLGQIMGLIGYYRIVDVISFIEAGVYNTTISAIWEAAGDGMSRSITDIAASQKNRICNNADDLKVKDEVIIRRGYTQSDVERLAPDIRFRRSGYGKLPIC